MNDERFGAVARRERRKIPAAVSDGVSNEATAPKIRQACSLSHGSISTTNAAVFYRLEQWEVLLDAVRSNFHSPGNPQFPASSWRYVGGELQNITNGPRVDIFIYLGDTLFDLKLEWAAGSADADSGIYYYSDGVRDSPELQLINNAGYPNLPANQKCGGVTGLFAPTNAVARPVGQFNSVRLIAGPGGAQHWLNGQKVLDYKQSAPQYVARYGRLGSGFFGFRFGKGASRFGNIYYRAILD